MADGQMNIRVNVDLNDMRRKAEEYRKEVTKMGVVTDESGNVISTAWQRVSDAAKKSNISRITEKMTGDVSANIEIQKKVLKDLEEQYKNVSKAVENAAPGVAKSKLQQELSAIKKEIDGEKQALQELEKVQQQYGQSNLTLRTQIYNVRNEMGRLRMQGQTNTEQYRQLEAELGRLGTAYRQLQYEQKALSTGATQWGGIISGIQGVTGAFAAAQGVMGLFVTDNEKLAKIQTRLQAVMAITIGMQQVSNTLHATSAFRMTTVRRVTELFTGAQTKLATALGISALKAQVLMGTLTLGLSAAITGIIYLINKWSSAQKKAAEEQKNIIDAQKRAAESIGEQVVSFKKLQKGWNELGDDLEKKKKYIIDNKDEMDKLGISVNNVSDAENLFVLNGDKFINALSIKAKAIASMELATEKYKKSISEMVEAEEKATKRLKEEILKRASGEKGEEIFKSTVDLLKDKDGFEKFSQQTWGKNIDFEKIFSKYNQAVEKFEEEGAKVDNFLKQQSEEFKKYTNILKDAGFTTTEEDEANKDAEEQAEKERKAAEARKKALQDYEKSYIDVLSRQRKLAIEAEQAKIDAQEDGYEKSRAQLELNLKKEKEAIYQQQQDILKLYQDIEKKKFIAEGGNEQEFVTKYKTIGDLPKQVQDLGALKTTAANEEYKRENAKLLEDVLKQYQTFSQKRLDIEKKYNKDISALKQAGASAEQVEEAKRQKDEALDELDLEFAEKQETFQSFMQSITNMSMQQLMENLQQARYLLSMSQLKGQDKQAAEAKAKVKALESQIKTLNSQKDVEAKPSKKWDRTLRTMREVQETVKDITDSFDGLDDATKSVLNAATNIAGSVIAMIMGIQTLAISGAEAVKGVEKASVILAVISAAVQVLMVIMNLFNKDKKREKAIQDLQKEVDNLNDAYEKLGKTIENTFSNETYNLMEEQRKNLQKQNELIRQQIEEERKKKKTDQGKIDDWENQIKKNEEAIADSLKDQMEMLAGTDIQTAIDDFADALVEAYEKGENAAEALGKTTKEILANAVKESLKKQFLGNAIQGAVEYLAKAMEDGILTPVEKSDFENTVKKAGEQFTEAMKMYDELFKGETNEDLKRQTGTISETITEKTATESMGIWRGSYDTLKAISQQTTMFHETYKSTMTTCNSILNTIARNTRETANNTSVLSDMRDTLKSMDGRLRTIESESSKRYAR